MECDVTKLMTLNVLRKQIFDQSLYSIQSLKTFWLVEPTIQWLHYACDLISIDNQTFKRIYITK